jgi:hypothetical protein
MNEEHEYTLDVDDGEPKRAQDADEMASIVADMLDPTV